MKIKGDSSYLKDKIFLRKKYIITGKEKILDCYAGKSIIWDKIKSEYPGLCVVSIEKEKKKNVKAICGDVNKVLPVVNLDDYDIIDLDAYGIPALSLLQIVEKKYKGVIILTWIVRWQRRLTQVLLFRLGFTEKMLDRAYFLLCRNTKQKLMDFLSVLGYKKVKYIEKDAGTTIYAAVKGADNVDI